MGNKNGSIFKVVKIEPNSFNFEKDWTTIIPLSSTLMGRSKREFLRIDRCCPEIEASTWLMRGTGLTENVRYICWFLFQFLYSHPIVSYVDLPEELRYEH